MSTAAFVAWLLTYVIHSTILVGGALLLCRGLGDRHLAAQETVLRCALVGGVITACLQTGLGIVPVGGAFGVVPPLHPNAPGEVAVAADIRASSTLNDAMASLPSSSSSSWPQVVGVLWILGACAGLIGIGRSMYDLRRLLRTRRLVPIDHLVQRLASAVGVRQSVRISTSKAIAVPFATGVRRPEVCCPERIADLATEHRTALLAHELAHVARHDPLWQLVYRVTEAVLCAQPLNRLAHRRLKEVAEHLTDERAVASTGNRLGLARCLVVMAHWQSLPAVGTGASATGPPLGRRVHRLLGDRRPEGQAPRWIVPIVGGAIAAAVVALPVISPAVVAAGHDDPASKTAPTSSTTKDRQPARPPLPVPVTPPQPTTPDISEPAPAAVPLDAELATAPSPSAAPPGPRPPGTTPRPQPEPAPPAPAAAPEPSAAPAPAVAPEDQARQRARREAEVERRAAERARSRAENASRHAFERAEAAAERATMRSERRLAEAEARAARHKAAEARTRRNAERACEARAPAEARSAERAAAAADRSRRLAEEAEARRLDDAAERAGQKRQPK
jgi:beta-lactamase regulating signal transducer with metallopeptidase domain